jgi:hypothetical protein|nr:MAG TPA: hypothetical protein [Microviridae sp.]
MFSKIRKHFKTCNDCCSGRLPDQNLSISPSEIMALTQRGIAASAGNVGLSYNEGSLSPVLTIDQLRGVDAADVWTAQKTARSNLIEAHKKSKVN